MAKTNEQLTKLVEKNYKTTQVQELTVYDKTTELHSEFTKQAKELEKQWKAELKDIDKKEKEAQTLTNQKLKELEEAYQKHLAEVAVKKTTAENLLQTQLTKNATTEQELLNGIQKDLEAIKKSFDKALKELDKKLKSDIEASEKQILSIQEKGSKDQASFELKITDLKAKYEAKVESLQEKQLNKIAKLTEAANKKVESLQASIVTERENVDKKASLKQAAYEEELEEINEKIAYEKSEFTQKYADIKDSAEKRIAIREKHLQRAISDNDQRSAKQHKKDIAKFQKEVDHDLAVLQKNYDQQSQLSATYPIKFKKDYLEECASRERDYAEFREQRQFEIDTQLIQLAFDVENTKLEYEKLLAEDLNKFNNDYAQIREKQETVKSEELVDLEKEKLAQQLLQTEWDRATKTEQENNKDQLETKAKEQRVIALEKIAEDEVAQNTLTQTMHRLDSEVEIAQVTLTHDQTVLKLKQQIESHTCEDLRHQAQKNEFLGYQQQLEPLFVERSKELHKYEELEINNRLQIKLAFYNEEQKVLDKDYELFLKKVEDTFSQEASFYEEKINAIAGSQKEELQAFIDEHEAKAIELQAKYESIENRKDRKIAENEYNDHMRHYTEERTQKEQLLQRSVGVYLAVLNDAKDRKEKALRDMKDLYDQGTRRVNLFIETAKQNAQAELINATKHVDDCASDLNQFNLQVASRNQQQTDANNTYLQTQIQTENNKIKEADSILENSRELLQQHLNSDLQALAAAHQQILSKKASDIAQQESNLEAFKLQIQNQIAKIKQDANNQTTEHNTAFANASSAITAALNQQLSEIRSTLANQVSDFNQNLTDISKRLQQAKTLLDNETKRVKKELDDRVKQEFSKINEDLQLQLKSVV